MEDSNIREGDMAEYMISNTKEELGEEDNNYNCFDMIVCLGIVIIVIESSITSNNIIY